MAYVADNRTTTISITDRLSTVFARIAETRAEQKLYRQTFNELNALSARELADLGIHRSSIKSIALEAARNAK